MARSLSVWCEWCGGNKPTGGVRMVTGRLWRRARRPELYTPLTVLTGEERDTRELKFQQ